ncbi:MAG: type III-A CRISPR-associated protein Csm2 [Thermoplasmataceae archaeon]
MNNYRYNERANQTSRDSNRYSTGSNRSNIDEEVRKFIAGENVDPEKLLGYEGSVRGFINSDRSKDDTSHQIRKFYSDIVDMWEISGKSSGVHENPEIPLLKIRLAMMEARLNYAKERKLISDEVFSLLRKSISTVNKESGEKWVQCLGRFKTFFEAFIAYSYKGR